MDSFSKNMEEKAKRRNELFKSQDPNADDFGYSLFNPIMTSTVFRSDEYLGRLRTENGKAFTWDRTKAYNIDLKGIKGVMVDEYELMLDGEPYKTIYICPYGHSSNYVPKGLVLADENKSKDSTPGTVIAKSVKHENKKAISESTKKEPSDSDADIATLMELLESGIITDKEYEAMVAKIDAANGTTEGQNISAHNPIDYDELKKLEGLHNEGLINDSDYNLKAADILGISNVTQASEAGEAGIVNWLKRNIIAAVIIILLAGALAFVGSQYAGMQGKINELNSTIESKESTITSLRNENNSLEGYKAAIEEFYIYGTVVAVENDKKYYHRYNCPETNMSQGGFRYLAFNENQAEAAGYSKCPTCFGYSDEEYCKKYIEK